MFGKIHNASCSWHTDTNYIKGTPYKIVKGSTQTAHGFPTRPWKEIPNFGCLFISTHYTILEKEMDGEKWFKIKIDRILASGIFAEFLLYYIILCTLN